MSVVIGKVRNKADEPVARNPLGQRLCGRTALSLVIQMELPSFAPRFARLNPQRPLRGRGYW